MIDTRTLRQRVQALTKQHGGLRAAARAIGLSAPYLVRLREGKHPQPSDATLRKLGMVRTVKLGVKR